MTRSSGRTLWERSRLVATNPRIWVLLGCYVLVLATTSDIAQEPTGDALDYRVISSAAPGLPNRPLGSAYAGRFAIHYLVGLLSHQTGMSLDRAYNLVFAALVIVMLAVVYLLFCHLSVGDFAICAALFLFSPYTTRLYIRQTGLVEATVFMIGVGICLLGLRHRSSLAVVGGLVVAVLGRQTAIMVAPVAAVWVLVDPSWRAENSTRRAWPTAISALIVTFGIYIIVKIWSTGFSGHFEPSTLEDSILGMLSGLPSTAMQLGAHVARTAIPLVIGLAMVAALGAIVGWRHVSVPCWGALAMAAGIVFQPLVTNPDLRGLAHNEQRLAALAILPLAYAVGELLSQTVYRRQRWYYPVLIVGLLAAASLHHEYAAFGAQSMKQFVGLQVVVAIAVGLILFRVREPVDRTGAVASARP